MVFLWRLKGEYCIDIYVLLANSRKHLDRLCDGGLTLIFAALASQAGRQANFAGLLLNENVPGQNLPLSTNHDARALNDVLQLANIPRPTVLFENANGLCTQSDPWR